MLAHSNTALTSLYTVDHQTPLSQFDFANFIQQPMQDNLAAPNADYSAMSVDNPHFVPPFFPNDPLMNIPGFDWVGCLLRF